MEIRYSIILRPQVIIHDIPRLDAKWKEAVKRSIRTKLTTHPTLYGKPLRQPLNNICKLRVGDYRVIFSIEGSKVIIIVIAHSSIVYGIVGKRI